MIHKSSPSRKVFVFINTIFLGLLTILMLIPVIHVLMASFSDPFELAKKSGLLLLPAGFSLEGYRLVLASIEVWQGYGNTIFYTVSAVVIGTFLTLLGAYTLSRKNLLWGNAMMFFITFTMIFNGGIVPTYLLINKLGWIDSPLAVIIPSCMSAYNLIIMRTFFQGIPESMEESAMLDGASKLRILFSIMIPLAKASIAVVALFYTVFHWNSFFQAMLYLRSRDKYPLQLVLREMLLRSGGVSAMNANDAGGKQQLTMELLKYSTIIVSLVPMLVAYPFIQKYFVSGVMIGAVKG